MCSLHFQHRHHVFLMLALSFVLSACTSWGHFWQVETDSSGNVVGQIQLRFADTGQTTCYNDSTSQGCGDTPTGWPSQDADFVNIPTARSFTGPTLVGAIDYISTDNVTGLVWKSCIEGLSDPACATGTASTFTLSPDTATPQCLSLNAANGGLGYAGRTNWRLPTVDELQTLANYSGLNPAIDAAYFPATASNFYWSSSIFVIAPSNAWSVSFFNGSVYNEPQTNAYPVRCVASIQTTRGVFIDNSDGTVTDSINNLTWQQCSAGLGGANCATGTAQTSTWQTALQYCKNLVFSGRTWRLPSISELKSICDVTRKNLAINTTYFPGTIANHYWSSSTNVSTSANAWYVNFADSGGNHGVKTATKNYRCVATGS